MARTKQRSTEAADLDATGGRAVRLRPLFSASVRTTNTVSVPTIAGPVPMAEEVFIKAGGELPENLAEGEYDRLAKLGAFDPLPPRPVSGFWDPVTGQQALQTPPGDDPVTVPSDVRIPTAEEQDARDRLAAAAEDVRVAVAEAAAEALADDGNTTPAGTE